MRRGGWAWGRGASESVGGRGGWAVDRPGTPSAGSAACSESAAVVASLTSNRCSLLTGVAPMNYSDFGCDDLDALLHLHCSLAAPRSALDLIWALLLANGGICGGMSSSLKLRCLHEIPPSQWKMEIGADACTYTNPVPLGDKRR